MQRLLRLVKNPWFIGVAVSIPLYAALGYLLIPFLIEHYGPRIASEKLRRQVSLGEVRFDPFRFTLDVRDFSLKEQSGEPIAALGRLFVDLEAESIPKRAVILDRILLEKPFIHAVIDPAGRLNFSKIADAFPPSNEPPPPDDQPPPAIKVRHSALTDGSVEYVDQSGGEAITQKVDAINLALDEISTLPDQKGPLHVKAKFADDSTLDWQGTVSLNPIFSEGEVHIDGFKLATPWDFIKNRVNLNPPGGQIDLAAQYHVRKDKQGLEATANGIGFKLGGLQLVATGTKEPMLSIDRIQLSDGSFDLSQRNLKILAFAIETGKIRATLDDKGVMNWQQIAKPAPSAPQAPAAQPATPVAAPAPAAGASPAGPPAVATIAEAPWHIDLGAFKIAGIGLQFVDESRAKLVELNVGGFGLGFHAAADVGAGEPKATVDDFGSEIKQIVLQRWGRKEPLASIDTIQVKGGHVDLAKREVTLQQILLSGGSTAISRDETGVIRPLDAFAPQQGGAVAVADPAQPQGTASEKPRPQGKGPARAPAKAPVKEKAATAPEKPAGKNRGPGKTAAPKAKPPERKGPADGAEKTPDAQPWRLLLQQAGLQGFRVAIADRSLTPALAYDLSDLNFTVKNLVNDGKTPVGFNGSLRIEQGGTVSVSGTAAQTGARADADVRVDRFDLTGLQPIIARLAALKLESGDVSTQMKVSFVNGNPAPSVKAKGTVKSTNLVLKESKTGKRFASWKNLDIAGIDFGLEPNKLLITEIRLSQPGSNIEIFQDRTTNIAAIFQSKAAPAAPGTQAVPTPVNAEPAQKPEAPPKTTAKPFPFSVERVRVDNATVDFSDESLVLPFKTRIQDFHGTVSGISSSPASRTQLEFEGRVDDYGEATLNGTLELMQFKSYSTVALIFRNVDMSSLSPYSGTFAGRRIKAGKLNVDLDYKIENSRLKSTNKITLDNLMLGEQVESPKAKSLPLDLAIALLTDNEGKITASIPIEGDINNPQFAYGQVIWDAISSLILRVVTAPFTALASVFSDGEDQAGEIFFGGGRDYLPPGEREKVKKVADAMQKRPKVALEIHGGFDPKLDGDTLKAQAVRAGLLEKLGITLKPGEDPGPVAFEAAKTQKALEDLAAEQSGGAGLQQALTEYRKKTGKEPVRIGGLSSLVGKATEDAEFYRVLFDSLAATTSLPGKDLESLADRRGQAILTEITTRARLDPSRVRIGTTGPRDSEEGRVPSQLDLAVSGS